MKDKEVNPSPPKEVHRVRFEALPPGSPRNEFQNAADGAISSPKASKSRGVKLTKPDAKDGARNWNTARVMTKMGVFGGGKAHATHARGKKKIVQIPVVKMDEIMKSLDMKGVVQFVLKLSDRKRAILGPEDMLKAKAFLDGKRRWERPIHERETFLNWISPLGIFFYLPPHMVLELSYQIVAIEYNAGDAVVHEGEVSTSHYIVFSGSLSVVTDVPGEDACAVVGSLRVGDGFCLRSMLDSSKSPATFRCREKCKILQIHQNDFLQVLKLSPQQAQARHSIPPLSHHTSHTNEAINGTNIPSLSRTSSHTLGNGSVPPPSSDVLQDDAQFAKNLEQELSTLKDAGFGREKEVEDLIPGTYDPSRIPPDAQGAIFSRIAPTHSHIPSHTGHTQTHPGTPPSNQPASLPTHTLPIHPPSNLIDHFPAPPQSTQLSDAHIHPSPANVSTGFSAQTSTNFPNDSLKSNGSTITNSYKIKRTVA
eukprot:TRINITY_DN19413_c0_g1::TRINITY_DN19413_c0_g1_i1::g.7783::m.7783 TRINITY_DN19413_c0_g1::TRINITY_DN19413_c0_g1_i1::g.7783  ORF type:complete len:480 (+),score=23.44,cNMP_binding/PF00027.24/3.7e+02,cNMP_binding/PF00027.24/3.4e-14 TRINITY_DN19413_c0_g1_i1:28-1467(+)